MLKSTQRKSYLLNAGSSCLTIKRKHKTSLPNYHERGYVDLYLRHQNWLNNRDFLIFSKFRLDEGKSFIQIANCFNVSPVISKEVIIAIIFVNMRMLNQKENGLLFFKDDIKKKKNENR